MCREPSCWQYAAERLSFPFISPPHGHHPPHTALPPWNLALWRSKVAISLLSHKTSHTSSPAWSLVLVLGLRVPCLTHTSPDPPNQAVRRLSKHSPATTPPTLSHFVTPPASRPGFVARRSGAPEADLGFVCLEAHGLIYPPPPVTLEKVVQKYSHLFPIVSSSKRLQT